MKPDSVKYAVIVIILIIISLTSCETENPATEDSSVIVSEDATIVVGEGSTVLIGEGVDIERQPDKPLSINQIHQRLCYVGDTVTIEGTVLKDETALTFGLIYLETGDSDVEFVVYTDALFHLLLCNDYYKAGETYEFKLIITGIGFLAAQDRPHFELEKGDAPVFRVAAELILTEELEREIREAGCWHDADQ